ncbi:bacillithiol biosynthesis cysteine-adding enzyme BshC [Flavobacterium aquidurense]|uniref:Putative cysteine ligase BshC n=1 Tax=Flavobacterium frigidimaris TaxID=262320 RepID=A0ABX4BND6_FLAFR|nr:bacillithiol biosynthesis cysteine-adding enzyme BshC [Flavobacterium frigidimaris]OXA77595.1 bacillithiol biosynthesis cysteine-adding enzyme BshC [Flavobacterium frigidimaris]SDY88674.1 bacillithiol biosynthesis cysteine-adding enzyme BshC [Flavobacterium aquidurense]
MPTDCISYQTSGYFSKLIHDYLDQKPELHSLYNHFPTLENFEKQIAEKQANFDNANRIPLVETLKKQYQNIEISEATKQNIELLAHPTTFTITTGHQLNLFSGPLYFLYKIISTINLTKELKSKYPAHNFVPVYWMATEDHDFEEINYFNFKGKKFRWNKESTGPVGRLSTEGLAEFFEIYSLELGSSTNASVLKKLFEEAYLKHENLADATRFLADRLFANYGLVILDADDADLKRAFIPFVREELEQQTSFKAVQETISKFGDYTVQVNPREINLFYIEDDVRERIIFEDDKYYVNNTKISFSKEEIFKLLESNPEKFSPNVIMRPLYQEIILPNLCYIGGGGEIAYWLELKSFFDAVNITFPMLLVRNSVLLNTEKQAKKADKLGLSWADLFTKPANLVNSITHKLSAFPIDLTPQKETLEKQFEYLYQLAQQTDKSFTGAVKAQEVKQKKGLENLEKRLLKAQKRKLDNELQRVTDLQFELFPNQSLQERQTNFSEFYLEKGDQLIPVLIQKLKPLENNFNIITI